MFSGPSSRSIRDGYGYSCRGDAPEREGSMKRSGRGSWTTRSCLRDQPRDRPGWGAEARPARAGPPRDRPGGSRLGPGIHNAQGQRQAREPLAPGDPRSHGPGPPPTGKSPGAAQGRASRRSLVACTFRSRGSSGRPQGHYPADSRTHPRRPSRGCRAREGTGPKAFRQQRHEAGRLGRSFE